LDLVAPAGRDVGKGVEDGRVEDVAADHRVQARGALAGRLLDQPGDADDAVLPRRFDGRAAVAVDLLRRDLHQRDHAALVALPDVQHPARQILARVDQVVAEQYGEGLVADVPAGAQHRVAEAEGLALADVVGVGQPGRVAHGVQAYGVPLGGEGLFEFEGVVEVVLDGPLVPTGDHQYVVQTGRGRLLDDVLDGRLVHDRQHLLGCRLGRGQEPGAEPGGRDDGLGDRAGGGGAGGARGVGGAIMRPMPAYRYERFPRGTSELPVCPAAGEDFVCQPSWGTHNAATVQRLFRNPVGIPPVTYLNSSRFELGSLELLVCRTSIVRK
jgi:hypothetical protein